ncbi:4069_t:CDS:1 [Paraglomus brasilianum]|uniref:4069_t:CDS:1 n=1 Tax=Paraglomus brasilianum TaxID=144538 RepID=A0A9N9G215_9GLOM|nr:4069_t:CDS:1 [Paraglomus brasilianum]
MTSNITEKHVNDGEEEKKVSFIQLFRFATTFDKILIAFGSIGAIANGTALPLMTIAFGGIITAFANFAIGIAQTTDDEQRSALADQMQDTVKDKLYYFIALGAGTFILSYLQMAFWMVAGENQAKRIREKYYAAIMRQDISFFDAISTGNVTSRISGDISLVQEGIAEKVGLIIQYLTTFVAGFIIAYTKQWKLSLVLTAAFPLLAAAAGLMSKILAAASKDSQDAYAAAGAVAEQAFSSIRTVAAFGGEERETQRYISKLDRAYKVGKKRALVNGVGMGSIMFTLFATYGLAFWYGATLIVDHYTDGGTVLNVFFAIIIGAVQLGHAAPNFAAIGHALGAAAKLYEVIDRVPKIDSESTAGTKLVKANVVGKIEFKNVDFHYPQRPDVPILKNFNLTIQPGQTVALVGSSGSGKSTIVSLLERFYDPVNGEVYLDGVDIKSINIKSLRSQIGLVGQEPVLFPTSIAQNIEWGAIPGEKEPTMDEIIEACRKANAQEFIEELSEKYATDVGEKGSLLSGGQKQRIAIARALIKDPRLLLLDEATSALDTESERLVQTALDAAAANRTTVVVAHRLSTIKNADLIVVMNKGVIIEMGKHDDLISKEGVYFNLVKAQELKTKKDTEKQEDDEDDSSSSGQSDEITVDMNGPKSREMMRRMSTKASVAKSFKSQQEIEEEEIEKNKNKKTPLGRIFRMNKPEAGFMAIGALGAIVNGSVMPLFSLVFSTILDIFSKTDDLHKMQHDANFWAGMFVVLAGAAFIANAAQQGLFILSGERLTRRLRSLTFAALIKQEIGFFDDEHNATGVLTSKLAVDASRVEGLTGSLMGAILSTVSSTVTGLTIAFSAGWKLALVVTAASPAIIASGALQMKSLAGYGNQTRKAYDKSGQVVQQSVSNMRTIAALTREDTFKELYNSAILEPHRIAVKGNYISSLGFGLSQGLLFFVWALAFWYGSRLMGKFEYTQEQTLRALFAVVFSAMSLGQMSSFAPSSAKAKIAAINVLEILDRKSLVDASDVEGKEMPAPITGTSSISNAVFNYPARPDVPILKGLNIDILAGKTIALVGPSGSGKSSTVSLLLRFYDVLSGRVSVEGVNVKDMNLQYLRSNMALVGQEPVLFDLTIGENIAYGKEGCSQEEIEQAAKAANIHNFIMSLPLKYDTRVGEKGTQLSGGQKQRIAIARALIRHPKILLLDEATSALDSESEKVVQDALDNASTGRTTITIAHRLSTIQNADLILVLKKGRVVEQGTHLQLINMKGLYNDLVTKQALINKESA